MTGLDFFSRYQMCAPVGQCGRSVFYLAKDKTAQAHVIIKQYISGDEEEALQREFEDETRVLSTLKEKGLIDFFEHYVIEGKFFLAFDARTACQWVCTHLSSESIDKAVKDAPL